VTIPLVTTPEADDHIRTIDSWWRTNRAAAPDLFAEELAACFELLAALPKIGRPYLRIAGALVRRVLLRSTRYHVYYICRSNQVFVLAVWHTKRGAGPDLSIPEPRAEDSIAIDESLALNQTRMGAGHSMEEFSRRWRATSIAWRPRSSVAVTRNLQAARRGRHETDGYRVHAATGVRISSAFCE
jgi:plasmid stabilization system protein ParE